MTEEDTPAGDFSSWLAEMNQAIRSGGPSDVPCGSCTSCCTASQFIHIAPDEKETLAHIDPRLVFPAPGAPRGHVLLGYDERGHCPMLVANRCTIYAYRPRTCRTYDCRVYAATDLIDDLPEEQRRVGVRAQRWLFGFPTPADRLRQGAVQAAARYLREHADQLPKDSVPGNPTQLAVMAILVHEVFLFEGMLITPSLDAVRVRMTEETKR